MTQATDWSLITDFVYMEAYPSSKRLRPRGKGRQLARANNTTLLDRATPTWTADQIIVIYFDGTNERAKFVRLQAEFDDWQTNPDWVASGASGSPTNRTVQFLKFAGAVNLANYRGS